MRNIWNWRRQQEIHEKSSAFYGDVYPDMYRFKVTNQFISSYLNSSTRGVLDVGCNTGYYLSNVNDPSARFGVDLSSWILKRAVVKASYICAVGEYLPFRSNTFDMLFCFELIEHVVKPNVLLVELARVMRPGGTLLLSTPVKPALRTMRLMLKRVIVKGSVEAGHVKEFSTKELVGLIKDNPFLKIMGFRVKRRSTLDFLIHNFPLARFLAVILCRLFRREPIVFSQPRFPQQFCAIKKVATLNQ